MTAREQQTLGRSWTRMVNGGIPLEEPFQIAVVRTHFRAGFEAGLRAGKKRAKPSKRHNTATRRN